MDDFTLATMFKLIMLHEFLDTSAAKWYNPSLDPWWCLNDVELDAVII